MVRNKTATAIAFILMLIIAVPIIAIQTVNAGFDNATQTAINQGMTWPPPGAQNANLNASATRLLLWNRFEDQIPTWVFLSAAPNPVGISEVMTLVMFNPQVPPGSVLGGDINYQYKINVVKPNNDTETLPATGTFVSDSTGSQFTTYTPDQTGVYKFTVVFQELFYDFYGSSTTNDYYGTTFLESSYTLSVTVQEQPSELIGLPAIPPLPTQYWTRPIEGENTNWYLVASNWYNNAHDRDNGGAQNRYQPDGIAPNSPHILWTRPTEDSGVVGGNDLGTPGNVFNTGSQYQPRFTSQIIMYGRLYFSPNTLTSGTSNLLDCVDLRTGELLWEIEVASTTIQFGSFVFTSYQQPAFGYYYDQDDPNEHGVQNPGWLFTSNYAISYQPERGFQGPLNITNVPSGFEVPGLKGENIQLVLSNVAGRGQPPNYQLSQWNSSKVIPMIGAGSNPTSVPIDGGSASRFDWGPIQMPWNFTSTPTVRAVVLNDILFGSNGSWPTGTSAPSYAYVDETTLWAVSLKPGSRGQPIYMKNIKIDNATDNTNILFEHASGAEGVCVGIEVPTCRFIGYNITTGDRMWATDKQADFNAYGYFTWPSLISQTQTKMAYGMLYTGGYTGAVSAYNLTNGNLEWRRVYPSGGEKIQNYVQMLGLICDGKIYVGTHEHSADTPLYKGEKVHCLNAMTGDEIWNMSSWAYPLTFATADGILIYWNNYDAQIYAIGKGPVQMSLQAPMTAVAAGDTAIIQGTVMDISAGTKQQEQAANFPNGVPAVSEASMSSWMEYVYMQKAIPSDVIGVEVSIDAIDPNGNCVHLGNATSDASGSFHLAWEPPDIPGEYVVIATFYGTESYWSSFAETAMYISSAPSPTAEPTPMPATVVDTYFVPAVIGIIIAIIVVGAIVILMLRRR